MRVVVLGSRGMLGVALCHQLRQAGFDVLPMDRSSFDALSLDLTDLLPDGCDALINACGMINRRLSESESAFLRVNSLFPRRLADLCEQRRIRMIQVSTDCVFKGDRGCYDESAVPDPDELYGMSKYWGEPSNAMVVRTSIIGPELVNHYSLLCWFLQQHESVRGFANHQWNGITTLELGRVLGAILAGDLWQPGVRHIFGEDLTKCTLLHLIDDAFQAHKRIDAVNDRQPRDTRLRTVYPEFMQTLNIAPMAAQLDRVRLVADRLGHWTMAP